MMPPLTPRQRRLGAVALFLALLALLAAAIALPLLALHRHYDEAIADTLDRTARFQRVATLRPGIEAAFARLDADPYRAHYLKNANPALASAELQDRVLQIAQASGIRITSTQVLPAREADGFRQVGLTLALTGAIGQIKQALVALESAQPLLVIESISIRSTLTRAYKPSPGAATPELQVNLTLVAQALVEAAP